MVETRQCFLKNKHTLTRLIKNYFLKFAPWNQLPPMRQGLERHPLRADIGNEFRGRDEVTELVEVPRSCFDFVCETGMKRAKIQRKARRLRRNAQRKVTKALRHQDAKDAACLAFLCVFARGKQLLFAHGTKLNAHGKKYHKKSSQFMVQSSKFFIIFALVFQKV